MIKSMTAFGRAKREGEDKDITIEIKSVNSRFFDCNVKIPRSYAFLEERIKSHIQKNAVSRAKVDVFVTVDRHTAANWDAFDYNAGFFRKIAEFCNERSINLVVVTLPAWHLYYNRLDDAQVEKMYQTVNAMQQEYGFRYLDYLRDGRFVEDDFYDVDHLSDVGALKFSSILKEDLGF